jgi:glycosyltransferase involved in cell wall biosynthesis
VKILHVINRLSRSGAEMMLYKLLLALPERENGLAHGVISLMDDGEFRPAIEALGVPVHAVGVRRGMPSPAALWRLRRLIAEVRPDLVQCWMYHSNVATSLAAAKRRPVVWGIRHSIYDLAREKRLTRWLIRSGPKLSGRVARIVYCSRASADQHEALRYPRSKTTVIPNGFDVEVFRPNDKARRELRAELGVPPEAVIVGHAARYHPMKNHAGLLRAFAKAVSLRHPQVHLAMAGSDVSRDNRALTGLIAGLDISERIHLLGERRDMPRLMAGFDIYASPSWSEAFPNVLGEAMASGLPCVATDVGDSAAVVVDTGRVVPPGDEAGLAEALSQLIEAGAEVRQKLGAEARKRIVRDFSLDAIAKRYVELYEEVARC